MPRLALYALVVCVLAVVAAVVSFVQGSILLGVVWVLLAGLSSNMAWFYLRKHKADSRTQAAAH
uniref:Secreted protein n=1 Tax=Streptomyces sp. NBC_01401 TaxID=2903854 RepID=A0AAU3H1C3_9ACTN